MSENDLSKTIVNTCFTVHRGMGPGLFESVYEEILCYELKKAGLKIERQKGIPVYWDSLKMDIGFKADISSRKK